mmetsp:Transcript_1301/g.1621  ORF Transcript_1301/g.1621 Transcript_1301/m.1621 type:complete len:198 (+) Transcript_1301:1468-2061(+)|eukprot:CAMPEP_0170507458 /NCGR_PEP_ID=MMETSP0208-20121228/58888_1 /TAXON_ID=197538 /ORGANISM="Strombidium inclinatum, Strain S3" /LENGTH=197 /DNA_ID=CAMNT_0010789653 /DNA_START=1410 /DNA_END=2003 /DNA_ORIENTATION=+
MSEQERYKFVQRKMHYKEPQANLVKFRVQSFNPAWFDVPEYFDYMADSFDHFLIGSCAHFTDKRNNLYVDVMRDVQTVSAMVFFLLAHIPLARLHVAYSLATALMPMMLSLKAKYWFYEKANALVVKVFPKDKEAQNFVLKPQELSYNKEVDFDSKPRDIFLTKQEAEQQENGAYITVTYLSLFCSLVLNFFFVNFL